MKRIALPLLVILSTMATTLSCGNSQGFDKNARTAYLYSMGMYHECDSIYRHTFKIWANVRQTRISRHAPAFNSRKDEYDALDRLHEEYRASGQLDSLEACRERLTKTLAAMEDPPADRLEYQDGLQSLANDVILMQTIVTRPKEAGDLSSYKEQVEILEQDIIKKSKYYLTHCSNNDSKPTIQIIHTQTPNNMKKLMTLFAFALVAFTANAQSTIKGDVNGDGGISITDVTTLVEVILTGIPQNTDTSIYDINGDGDITVSDVTVLVDMILNGNGGNGSNLIVTTLHVLNIGNHYIEVKGSINNAQKGNTNKKVGIFYNKSGEPDETNGTMVVGEIYETYEEEGYSFFRAKIDKMKSKETYYYRAFEKENDKYLYGETKSIKIDFDQMTCPDDNHPHAIDLGLPSGNKWSCRYLNESSSYECFQWGETSGFTFEYLYNYDNEGNLNELRDYEYGQYVGNQSNWWSSDWYEIAKNYYCDSFENICGTDKDAAYVNLGDGWQMPSMNDCIEFFENCTFICSDCIYIIGPNGTVLRWWWDIFRTWTGEQCPYDQKIWYSDHYFQAYLFDFDATHIQLWNDGGYYDDGEGLPYRKCWKWYHKPIIPIHK